MCGESDVQYSENKNLFHTPGIWSSTLINKKIKQAYQHNREDGDVLRDYYDPNTLLADKHYRFGPKENIMFVINSSGYHYNDDTVYTLDVSSVMKLNDSDNYLQRGQAYQMCLLVKNCSSERSIMLEINLPFILFFKCKLCFCTYGELTHLRHNLRDIDYDKYSGEDVVGDNVPMFPAAADESIVINY